MSSINPDRIGASAALLDANRMRFGVESAIVGGVVWLTMSLTDPGGSALLLLAGGILVASSVLCCLATISMNYFTQAVMRLDPAADRRIPEIKIARRSLSAHDLSYVLFGCEILCLFFGFAFILAGVSLELCVRTGSTLPIVVALLALLLALGLFAVALLRVK